MSSSEKHTHIPKLKENLKQRAYLNSVTSVLDYGARVVTGFIVTPFLVNGLGAILFGVWQVLGQFASYTSLADIRATQVLKWAIAKDRDTKNGDELKEYVTATFLLILLVLPLFLIVGAIITWYSPIITSVDKEYYSVVRITCGILVLTLVTQNVFSIFESILRGMNLGFKRMGFRATITIFGGALQIGVIVLGYGLISLALVQLFVSFLIGVTIYIIVKKHVVWFGLGKPDIKRSLSFLKISGWFMGWTGTNLLLISSDKILLGYIAGPLMVTQYVITQYLVNTVQGTVGNVVHGVIPGIGKLFGNGEFVKLHKAREQIMLITWLISVTIGGIVIIYNEAFIQLWLGEGKFAGQIANILIIIMIVQYIFIQNDGTIIDTTLEISQKVYLALISAIISIIMIIMLVPEYGIAGLCVGIITGRLIMSIGYPYVIYKKTGVRMEFGKSILRPFLVQVVMWGLALYISKFVIQLEWHMLVLLLLFSALFIFCSSFFLGLNKNQRSYILAFKNKIKFLSTDS